MAPNSKLISKHTGSPPGFIVDTAEKAPLPESSRNGAVPSGVLMLIHELGKPSPGGELEILSPLV